MEEHALRLTELERECRRLHYAELDANFARNSLVELLEPEADEKLGEPPKVTFYVVPPTAAALDLNELFMWLDPQTRRYDPAKHLRFVPPYKHGIVDGIACTNAQPRARSDRFLAVRRTGTVELGVYCSWLVANMMTRFWFVSLKQVLLQLTQLVAFVADLNATFKLSSTSTFVCNVRSTDTAILGAFGAGWSEPWEGGGMARSSEPRFQLRSDVDLAATPASLVSDFAARFELSFGGRPDRAFDRVGPQTGELNLSGVDYR